MRVKLLRLPVIFALLGSALGAAPSPAILREEFIHEPSTYPQCHASTIVETTAGTLVAAWFGGTHERHPDVCIWLRRCENGRWLPEQMVADGVQSPTLRYPTWNPVLFQPRRGPLMLFYKVGPSPETWWGMLTTSDDDGRTWSTPRRLPDGMLGPIKDKPIELAGGHARLQEQLHPYTVSTLTWLRCHANPRAPAQCAVVCCALASLFENKRDLYRLRGPPLTYGTSQEVDVPNRK